MESLTLTIPSGASIEIHVKLTPEMEGQMIAWMKAHPGDEEE